MIIWLASYPRSGNTLLRLLCWRVFGIDSTSVYYADKGLKFLNNEGFKWFSGPQDLRKAWGSDERPHLVKTHFERDAGRTLAVTPRDIRTIFVVRDGRPAAVSFRHYCKDFSDRERSLLDIAKSSEWSQMLTSWVQDKPDTTLVKYEDVLAAPDKVVKQLADFLGVKPIGKWVNDFSMWQTKMPKFFRSGGNDKWKAEWSPELEAAFMQTNGAWMRKLGYHGPKEQHS